MALLILLNNTLCVMNMLVLVWLLQKPQCGYYRSGFYCMTMINKLRYHGNITHFYYAVCRDALVLPELFFKIIERQKQNVAS